MAACAPGCSAVAENCSLCRIRSGEWGDKSDDLLVNRKYFTCLSPHPGPPPLAGEGAQTASTAMHLYDLGTLGGSSDCACYTAYLLVSLRTSGGVRIKLAARKPQAGTELLLPPWAGEGWDGGDEANARLLRRGAITCLPPPRSSTACGGGSSDCACYTAYLLVSLRTWGGVRIKLAARKPQAGTELLLPPWAGEGWDGGDEANARLLRRGAVTSSPPPRPSPARRLSLDHILLEVYSLIP